jgi:hypothetical protein
MTNVATLIFIGRFHSDSFLEFVHHRAERLALNANVLCCGSDCVEVSISGQADLLDAFELACSLGPIDCLVLEHYRAGGGEATFSTRPSRSCR